MKTYNYVCRKALLTDDLKKIAKCIYFTDPYIYPSICDNPNSDEWYQLIKNCLNDKNNIFNYDNILVILLNNNIIGIACVVSSNKQLSFMENIKVPTTLQEKLKKANDGYFSPLIEETKEIDGFNITNICIDEKYRGCGAGKTLLKYIIEQYNNKKIYLDVIASNIPALKLYEKCGFIKLSEYMGFAGTEDLILCYHMVKNN